MSQNNSTVNDTLTDDVRIALLSIYCLVFVIGGLASTATMVSILNSNVRSVTTMAVINLIMVHYLFLLTVPFRLHYYFVREWRFSGSFCRLVSAMLHGHMFIAFIFYVIILVMRDISFFKRTDKLEFYRKLHALAVSAAIWAVIFGVFLPLAFVNYKTEDADTSKCFNFAKAIDNRNVKILNFALSGIVLLTVLSFTCCQVYILATVVRRHGVAACRHQEFWAQLKSLLFITVMVVCFFPYHMFRIYYVLNVSQSDTQNMNEVFLAVTALSCFDMLIFLGRTSYLRCKVTCCV